MYDCTCPLSTVLVHQVSDNSLSLLLKSKIKGIQTQHTPCPVYQTLHLMDIPAPLSESSSSTAFTICPKSPARPKLERTTILTKAPDQVCFHLVVLQKLNVKGEVYVTPMTGYPPGSTVFQDIVSYLSGIADPKMPPIPKSKAISHITFTRHNTQEEARTAAARGGDKGPQTHSWPFGKPASTSQASSDSARSITIASSNPSIEIPNSPGRGEMANATSQRGLEDAFFGIGHGASIAESSLT
jgi:hypothetical protein